MECPCEKCLVKPACRSRVVKKNKGNECLVVEYLEECPMIIDYFTGVNEKIIHTYEKIYKVCECMNVPDDYFIWHANEIRLLHS